MALPVNFDSLSPTEQIAILRAENDRLSSTARPERKVSVKVNPEKGTISVYLGGRYPCTLYRNQWNSLMNNIGLVKTAIEAHKAELDAVDARRNGQTQE